MFELPWPCEELCLFKLLLLLLGVKDAILNEENDLCLFELRIDVPGEGGAEEVGVREANGVCDPEGDECGNEVNEAEGECDGVVDALMLRALC